MPPVGPELFAGGNVRTAGSAIVACQHSAARCAPEGGVMTTFAPSVTSTATGVAPCAALAKSTFASGGGCVGGGDVPEAVQPASAPMTRAAPAHHAAADLRRPMAGVSRHAPLALARFRCGL